MGSKLETPPDVPVNLSPENAGWVAAARNNPVAALLLTTISVTLLVFFCLLKLYAGESIMVWAWKHWLPNLNQEHGKLVIPISLALVWYHRKKLQAAQKKGSNLGLIFLAAGFALLLLGVRASEPRITLLSIPTLLFGAVLFLWGKEVARILAFPIGFLIFMIPVGALQQTSFHLQFLITQAVVALSRLVGIKVYAVGTTILPVNGSWGAGFEIAEGCSGIRSLIAIIMLTAIYAHIFEKEWWKKIVLLAFSVGFAMIANAGRVFVIILIAQMGYPKLAGGLIHEYSGFVSFPLALLAMLFCHKLMNWKANKAGLGSTPSGQTANI